MPNLDEDAIALLSKKIDDQGKFTRMIIIVCCLTVLASMFYSLSAMVEILPDIVFAKLLGNVDSVQREWHTLDRLAASKEHK